MTKYATYRGARAAQTAANRARRAARVAENLQLLRAYLHGHPCTDCGEPDIVVLEFDHTDPAAKTCNVSELVHAAVRWERVLGEIAKCEVVCANCHRRRTARRAGYHSWTNPLVDEEKMPC